MSSEVRDQQGSNSSSLNIPSPGSCLQLLERDRQITNHSFFRILLESQDKAMSSRKSECNLKNKTKHEHRTYFKHNLKINLNIWKNNLSVRQCVHWSIKHICNWLWIHYDLEISLPLLSSIINSIPNKKKILNIIKVYIINHECDVRRELNSSASLAPKFTIAEAEAQKREVTC